MSYKYARVPLEGCVNLIIGPNGLGKSTILLVISVTIGRTYAERRRLSDPIRRGRSPLEQQSSLIIGAEHCRGSGAVRSG